VRARSCHRGIVAGKKEDEVTCVACCLEEWHHNYGPPTRLNQAVKH